VTDDELREFELKLQRVEGEQGRATSDVKEIKDDIKAIREDFRESLHAIRNNLQVLTLEFNRIQSSLVKTDSLEKIVMGNGSEDLGLRGRIKVLEDTEKKRAHHFTVVWTALLGVLAKVLYDLLNK
jgi:hypothetical protein